MHLIHTKKIPSKILTVNQLEEFGRVQLSPSFFMRDFLYSEISQIENIPNIPHYPEIAIQTGSMLCQKVLEPLQEAFGRISIRSGYRCPEVNTKGAENKNQYRCASNERNYARHIWDYPDKHGNYGAMACVVVNSYLSHYEATKDWETLSQWMKENIRDYSEIHFFPKLCAFNISWNEAPKKIIKSSIRNPTQNRT